MSIPSFRIAALTTEFVLDENTAYARILGEVRSDGSERLYAYGPDGFTAQLAVGSAVEYLLLDGLGSVRYLTDASGTVILSRSYDAYGAVRLTTGMGSSRLGYTGELQDSVSGLVYLRARHYHPMLGRFLQRDSFGGFGQYSQSLNRYSYVENKPLKYIDPSGHCLWDLCLSEGALLWLAAGAMVGTYAVYDYQYIHGPNADESQAALVDAFNDLGDQWFGAPPPTVPTPLIPWVESYPGRVSKPGSIFTSIPLVDSATLDCPIVQPLTVPNAPFTPPPLVDPLPTSSMDDFIYYANKLRENMIAGGQTAPADWHAHHIVAANDQRAAVTIDILKKAGIDINDVVNGVFLPADRQTPNPTGATVHSTVHTDVYYREVEHRLMQAGSNVRQVLDQIRSELQWGVFPH